MLLYYFEYFIIWVMKSLCSFENMYSINLRNLESIMIHAIWSMLLSACESICQNVLYTNFDSKKVKVFVKIGLFYIWSKNFSLWRQPLSIMYPRWERHTVCRLFQRSVLLLIPRMSFCKPKLVVKRWNCEVLFLF